MSAGSRAARWAWVTAGYLGLATAITWPLVTRLSSAIAGDLGDPLFVAWVMAWVDDHLIQMLRGVPGAWDAMWQAPIFAPAPHALTFSEHFIGQAVQALPVAWLGGNPVAAYNVIYVLTLVLTGVFTHGLALRLTGSRQAAVAAGVLATYNDYRVAWSLGHLHTLSIHWWVAALWAIDVWVETGRARALAAAAAALVLLHLSSSYLMAYCAPLTIGFALWALARHDRWRDAGRWAGLGAAAGASIAAVVPILGRYLATQSALAAGSSAEIAIANSATFAAYAGEARWLAPLAGLAVLGALAPPGPAGPAAGPGAGPAVTPRLLSRRQRVGLLGLAGLAFVFAMGPEVRAGHVVVAGPYEWLRSTIPGYAGLRVPHRFAAPGVTLLALLAGAGAAWVTRRRAGWVAAAAGIALATGSAILRPFPLNAALDAAPLVTPPAPPFEPAALPAIYRHLRTIPADSVVVEFPFGSTPYEVRFTYFTRAHQRRLVNGYSGLLPAGYLAARAALRDPLAAPDRAAAAMGGATHAIVHAGAWPDDTGARLARWLERGGARLLARADGAALYDLRAAGAARAVPASPPVY
jgi:hypothetical protein